MKKFGHRENDFFKTSGLKSRVSLLKFIGVVLSCGSIILFLKFENRKMKPSDRVSDQSLIESFALVRDSQPKFPANFSQENQKEDTPLNKSSIRDLDEPKILEFREMTEKALQGFPTRAQLQKLEASQVHGTPPAIFEAGMKLGEIAELVAQNSKFKMEGIHFYQKCSRSEDFPVSIRATCYAALKKLDPISFGMGHEDPSVSILVQKLAAKIE